jgi:hypothetical protein
MKSPRRTVVDCSRSRARQFANPPARAGQVCRSCLRDTSSLSWRSIERYRMRRPNPVLAGIRHARDGLRFGSAEPFRGVRTAYPKAAKLGVRAARHVRVCVTWATELRRTDDRRRSVQFQRELRCGASRGLYAHLGYARVWDKLVAGLKDRAGAGEVMTGTMGLLGVRTHQYRGDHVGPATDRSAGRADAGAGRPRDLHPRTHHLTTAPIA